MRAALHPHPETPCDAVAGIEVEVWRDALGLLNLRYVVSGDVGDIRLAQPSAPVRADGLWKETCFEAFVRASGEEYREFNFAPSTQWAAYRFGDYRTDMAEANVPPPNIVFSPGSAWLEMQAEVRPDLSATEPWRLGIAAVIEEANGRKSYWALKHPTGQPDFHHPDCFAIELAPPA